jgi:hypothetical protein
MSYEVFRRQRVPRALEPHVTIHRRGTIALNTPAWEALGSPTAVELLFDREKQAMAFRAVDASASHGYRLRPNGTSASSFVLSGTAFFQYYEIPLTREARRMAAKINDGVLVVDLKQEGLPLPARRASKPGGNPRSPRPSRLQE